MYSCQYCVIRKTRTWTSHLKSNLPTHPPSTSPLQKHLVHISDTGMKWAQAWHLYSDSSLPQKIQYPNSPALFYGHKTWMNIVTLSILHIFASWVTKTSRYSAKALLYANSKKLEGMNLSSYWSFFWKLLQYHGITRSRSKCYLTAPCRTDFKFSHSLKCL